MSDLKRNLKADQIEEWFESQVTEYFFSLIENLYIDSITNLAEQGFDTVSAEQLQAQRGNLWGIRNVLHDLREVYTSKGFSLLEEEDGEHVGDLPEGRQTTH